MPTNLTPQSVRKSWDDLTSSGELVLGEPCSPYTLTRYTAKEGKTIAKELVTLCGKRFPLATLREKCCTRISCVFLMTMQSHSLQESNSYSSTQVYHTVPDMAKAQRRQCLVLWHDHATILSTGFLMITVHTLYDPAVFLTNSEYQQCTQIAVDIQTEVEKPEIYMHVGSGIFIHRRPGSSASRQN